MKLAATAACAMFATACQPITVEPDAGPPVNHPPFIDEGFETPAQAAVDGYQASDGCTRDLGFGIGKVEDDDIDQNVQEHWLLDFDPSNSAAVAFTPVTLTQDPAQPAIRTDTPNTFVVTARNLQTLDVSKPHVVDVFISDGFDNVASDGGAVRPDSVLPGFFLLRHSWVIYMSQACTP
jgi:hypothetical protein